MAKDNAVFGIYRDRAQAAKAVGALRESGFPSTDVSVVMPHAGSGALLGDALGWLAEAGTLVIPGGPFVATGPLMGLLENVGVGGTVEGLAGALIGAGAPEHEARHYQGRLQSGRVLLSVHCADAEKLAAAREILQRAGAEPVRPAGDSASDHEADFRHNFATTHADFGAAYKDAAPIYEFGFKMARSERFAGRNFEDSEPDLKAAYLQEFPSGDWDQVSNLALYGWEQAGGAIRQGFALI